MTDVNEHGELLGKGDDKAKESKVSNKSEKTPTGAARPNAAVKAQPVDPVYVSDPKEKRIEYLRAKSDRTLEEGLELQELELGVEKSKEINAGFTSDRVHDEQMALRDKEKQAEAKKPAPIS